MCLKDLICYIFPFGSTNFMRVFVIIWVYLFENMSNHMRDTGASGQLMIRPIFILRYPWHLPHCQSSGSRWSAVTGAFWNHIYTHKSTAPRVQVNSTYISKSTWDSLLKLLQELNPRCKNENVRYVPGLFTLQHGVGRRWPRIETGDHILLPKTKCRAFLRLCPI